MLTIVNAESGSKRVRFLDDSLPFLELIRRDLIRRSRGKWERAQPHDASEDVTILPTRPFDLVTALVWRDGH